jgi:cystathionine beta-synthase
MNPTGSVKDRAAFAMIEAAERSGAIVPNQSTLVEATAGNTGAGLAAAAGGKYKIKAVMMDKFGPEKVSLMRAWGAEIIICPSNVSRDAPDFWLNTARRLGEQEPYHFYIDQFNNRANPDIHYRTTGPEIWEQTEGKVDAVVAGFGTGGTIMGVARFLRSVGVIS